jgi:uncharacterized protein YndB with AHSA1/START domain
LGALKLGDMHHAAVAIEELWAERAEPKTATEVAEKLRWFEPGHNVDVVTGGGEHSTFESRGAPETHRAAVALEAAMDHGLILREAIRA